MDAKNFVEIAKTLPVEIPVLLRGPHGIGKSQITGKQLATYFNLPLLDIRLSQRDAGDVIGLPVVTDDMTRFNPPDWVHRACREPVLLFLDELNRATQEVRRRESRSDHADRPIQRPSAVQPPNPAHQSKRRLRYERP